MTLFVDDPKLLNCFKGIRTSPSSEAPLTWRRLIAFDDCLQDKILSTEILDYAHITVDILVNKSPGWQRYIGNLRDIAEDPTSKTIYICSHFTWYEAHVYHPATDFGNTSLIIHTISPGIFEGFKDGDIVTCPSECSLRTEVEVNHWLAARDKAQEIESQIDSLSLQPYPLTHDDLIERLVDKIRLLVQLGANDHMNTETI